MSPAAEAVSLGRVDPEQPQRSAGETPPRRVLTIFVDDVDPPTGELVLPDGVRARFVGWLGLLSLVSDLVPSANTR